MQEENTIRDLRKGGKFLFDNIFIDEYSEIVGIYATGVYLTMCRHSNNETQKCYPARKTIAKKLGISVKSVDRGISKLVIHKIIKIKRLGNQLNNNYIMLDYSEWKK